MAEEDADLDPARQGDREAFGRLVRRHPRRAYAASLPVLGSPTSAHAPPQGDRPGPPYPRRHRGLASQRAGSPPEAAIIDRTCEPGEVTTMSDDVDDLPRRTMATLDRQVPDGYFDTLVSRTLLRLDAPA